MDKQTRMQKLLERVKDQNGESIRTLALQFGVTEMTIRRDVEQLKAAGLVRVVAGAVLYSGSAASAPPEAETYELAVHDGLRTAEKRRIGKLAASLVQPGDVLYFDVGTTTPHIIPFLPDGQGISAVCCTMNALTQLQKKAPERLIVAGASTGPTCRCLKANRALPCLQAPVSAGHSSPPRE